MKLTDREKQILIKIAQGDCNKKIANDLFIAVSTARKHRQNIYRKIRVKNLAQLTAYAIDFQYVENSDFTSIKLNKKPTRRETQFMELASQGLPDKQIAIKMRVAYSTARKHRENIYLKMGFRNIAELTAFYKFNTLQMPNKR